MSRTVKLKVGVEQDLKEITTEIPDNEPKPWDGSVKLKYIGGRTPRIDGIEKTTGKAKYTYDIKLPGLLQGKFLRSPYPSCVVKSIDISKAENYPGVKAVILIQDTLPIVLRYAGQEILAVAAETTYQAEEALKFRRLVPVITFFDE